MRVIARGALILLALAAGCGSGEESLQSRSAAVSSTVTITASITGSTLTVKTSDMPKGWYTDHGGLDPNKSPISLSWHIAASGCLPEASGTATQADGTFAGVTNPGGQTNAYNWTYAIDLAAYQNHWNNHILCDGSTVVEGCTDARTVEITLTVGGACIGAGCTATGSATLDAVQDPDVVDTNCVTECDIGACVSACQAACANGDNGCSQCCECGCKAEAYAAGNTSCQPQGLCYTGSKGHRACLAE